MIHSRGVMKKLFVLKYEVMVPVLADTKAEAISGNPSASLAFTFCSSGVEATLESVLCPERLSDLPETVRDIPPVNALGPVCSEIISSREKERDRHQLKLFG